MEAILTNYTRTLIITFISQVSSTYNIDKDILIALYARAIEMYKNEMFLCTPPVSMAEIDEDYVEMIVKFVLKNPLLLRINHRVGLI